MFMVFIHGPAASGKYTIGKLVAEALGVRLFHNHLVVDALLGLFEFGSPAFRELRERFWLGAFEGAAQEGRSFVFTFLPESTVSERFSGEALRVVEQAGGAVFFVELTCSDETVLARLDQPGRSQFGKLTSAEEYRLLAAQGAFAYPEMPPSVIDVATDAVSAEEAASLIVAAVRNAVQARGGA